jgi:hypothetical protein
MEQQEAAQTAAPKARRQNTKTPTANFTQTQENTHTDSHQPTINLPSPAGNDPKDKGYFLDRESKQHLRPPLPPKGEDTQALMPSISISPVPGPSQPGPRRNCLLSSSTTSGKPSPRARAATEATWGWVVLAARRIQ